MRPPWFSKPASTRSPLRQRGLDRDVADQAGAVLAHSAHIQQLNPRQLLAGPQLIGAPQQLVAATDTEYDCATRRGGVQRLALGRDQILGAEALVAILAAAEVEEVVGVAVGRLTQPAGVNRKLIPRQAQRRSSTSRLPRSA